MRSLAHPKGGVRVRFPVDFECWLALVRSGITRDETAYWVTPEFFVAPPPGLRAKGVSSETCRCLLTLSIEKSEMTNQGSRRPIGSPLQINSPLKAQI
jgi:hypothetical protein